MAILTTASRESGARGHKAVGSMGRQDERCGRTMQHSSTGARSKKKHKLTPKNPIKEVGARLYYKTALASRKITVNFPMTVGDGNRSSQ